MFTISLLVKIYINVYKLRTAVSSYLKRLKTKGNETTYCVCQNKIYVYVVQAVLKLQIINVHINFLQNWVVLLFNSVTSFAGNLLKYFHFSIKNV